LISAVDYEDRASPDIPHTLVFSKLDRRWLFAWCLALNEKAQTIKHDKPIRSPDAASPFNLSALTAGFRYGFPQRFNNPTFRRHHRSPFSFSSIRRRKAAFALLKELRV
jgi:hypothetical protein